MRSTEDCVTNLTLRPSPNVDVRRAVLRAMNDIKFVVNIINEESQDIGMNS